MPKLAQPPPVVGPAQILTNPYRPRVRCLAISTAQLHQWVNVQRLPMCEVARLSGLSRQAVWKRLNNAGQFVPRKQLGGAPGVWMTVHCAWCGVDLRRRTKVSVRKLRNFCNADCHYAALEAPGYFPWRQGSRLARALVAQRFALDRDHIVHHKDGNQRHNDLANLAVYATQADHMAHHRGRRVLPIWDGGTA